MNLGDARRAALGATTPKRIGPGAAMLDGALVWVVSVDRLRRVAVLEDGRRVDYEADGRPFSGFTPAP